jgi:oligopeptide/dipeptide ABC transporter ATP-binding protein
MSASTPLLQLHDYSLTLQQQSQPLPVLHHLNLSIEPHETVGIVGESGCGKSLTALSILGLISRPPLLSQAGELRWRGRNLLLASNREWRKIRGNEIAMIFQEPMTALNPVLRIGEQLEEVLREHTRLSGRERRERCAELLRQVGIREVEEKLGWYPHQFSGGMRQRVMIAMALINEPDLLIADEPTTALDVTTQAQILQLLQELQRERHMAMLFISHDLDVVGYLVDRVIVMYAGEIIEEVPVAHLETPSHPYTIALQQARPRPEDTNATFTPIPGALPSLRDLPQGCRFYDRCAFRQSQCAQEAPPRVALSEQHAVRCWFPRV